MYIKSPEKFITKNTIEKLDLEQANEIYEKLVSDLKYYNYSYYVKSKSIISDYEYDLLFHYLEKLEKKIPQLIKSYSPTQRLINQIQTELKKTKHDQPLLSLGNTYSAQDVEEKLEKYGKDHWIEKFYIEPKYDGLSIELIYENWIFQKAITRWDGFIWEDVTENVKTINTLPLDISYTWNLNVRWEIVVKKSIFDEINEDREKQKLDIYSNPRNLASGSLRQLDPNITKKRQLDVICYEVLNFSDVNYSLDSHHKGLDFLEKNWFWILDFKSLSIFKERKSLNKKEVLDIVNSEKIKKLLDNQDVEFDWLVIKVDEEKYWDVLWNTAHHPKWAFAFKYPAKQISTKLLDVELSVWRTWAITPVAILEPVNIWWVIVKRASLHNFDFIKKKDIRIWDYIFIQRSWEVIPYIVSVIKEKREWELSEIKEPKHCPVCGWDTFHPENEVALKCINVTCPAQVKEKITYFVSKNWLDIEWLSEKTIEVLLNVWFIKDYADIFTLTNKRQQLLALPWFKEKKVENILNAIKEKNIVKLDIFLQALGIEFIWKKTAKIIVSNLILLENFKDFLDKNWYIIFKKIIDFLVTDEWTEFLLNINGIWPKVVESIKKFFHEKHNKKVIEKLINYIKIKSTETKKWKFFWKQIVITGSIEWISRQEIANFIENNGWDFSSQITKETSLLLVGHKTWNGKLKNAKEYNIPTYDLINFLKANNFNFSKQSMQEESLF